jgi:hypothetical protein
MEPIYELVEIQQITPSISNSADRIGFGLGLSGDGNTLISTVYRGSNLTDSVSYFKGFNIYKRNSSGTFDMFQFITDVSFPIDRVCNQVPNTISPIRNITVSHNGSSIFIVDYNSNIFNLKLNDVTNLYELIQTVTASSQYSTADDVSYCVCMDISSDDVLVITSTLYNTNDDNTDYRSFALEIFKIDSSGLLVSTAFESFRDLAPQTVNKYYEPPEPETLQSLTHIFKGTHGVSYAPAICISGDGSTIFLANVCGLRIYSYDKVTETLTEDQFTSTPTDVLFSGEIVATNYDGTNVTFSSYVDQYSNDHNYVGNTKTWEYNKTTKILSGSKQLIDQSDLHEVPKFVIYSSSPNVLYSIDPFHYDASLNTSDKYGDITLYDIDDVNGDSSDTLSSPKPSEPTYHDPVYLGIGYGLSNGPNLVLGCFNYSEGSVDNKYSKIYIYA